MLEASSLTREEFETRFQQHQTELAEMFVVECMDLMRDAVIGRTELVTEEAREAVLHLAFGAAAVAFTRHLSRLPDAVWTDTPAN